MYPSEKIILAEVSGMIIWVMKRINRVMPPLLEKEKLDNRTRANNDCAAVSTISMDCLLSIGKAASSPADTEYTIGRVPTNKVHWLILYDNKTVNAAEARDLRAKIVATAISGDSEANGATHWIKKNSSIPAVFPVIIRP